MHFIHPGSDMWFQYQFLLVAVVNSASPMRCKA